MTITVTPTDPARLIWALKTAAGFTADPRDLLPRFQNVKAVTSAGSSVLRLWATDRYSLIRVAVELTEPADEDDWWLIPAVEARRAGTHLGVKSPIEIGPTVLRNGDAELRYVVTDEDLPPLARLLDSRHTDVDEPQNVRLSWRTMSRLATIKPPKGVAPANFAVDIEANGDKPARFTVGVGTGTYDGDWLEPLAIGLLMPMKRSMV